MENAWEIVSRVLPVLLPAVVALVGLGRGPGALRSRLRHDVELLEKLPEGSGAHADMLELVAAQVARVKQLETQSSRDIPGAVTAAIMALLLGYLAVWLWTFGSWWTQVLAGVSAFVAIVCAALIFDYVQRVPRDENRKRK